MLNAPEILEQMTSEHRTTRVQESKLGQLQAPVDVERQGIQLQAIVDDADHLLPPV